MPKDFRRLIQELVATHHGGNYYAMAKRLGVSSGLPYQWRDGTVKQPSRATVAKLCAAYGLDPAEVIQILAETALAELRRPGRTLPVLVLGSLLAGVPAWAGTPDLVGRVGAPIMLSSALHVGHPRRSLTRPGHPARPVLALAA